MGQEEGTQDGEAVVRASGLVLLTETLHALVSATALPEALKEYTVSHTAREEDAGVWEQAVDPRWPLAKDAQMVEYAQEFVVTASGEEDSIQAFNNLPAVMLFPDTSAGAGMHPTPSKPEQESSLFISTCLCSSTPAHSRVQPGPAITCDVEIGASCCGRIVDG